ncbi:hypothetical protein [Levilactobacillus fuyuanensis]|uniref:Uncharacterized protein n=1 Tax=Levilactobacillus fuyuanensis TaxID=2486022 RepID=A0ABW4H020_9LACO|nr:hypothetical protein [Levilactobacillus fuyuanensis]
MASNDEQRSATTILTTAAQSIAARLIANETTAKFTKAEISTTNLFNQSVTELQVLTSLDNVQQTADINTVTVINNNTVNVNVAIDQTKAPNNYQMNSVGLFAVDGDGKEVLYSVTVLKDPVYIHQDAMGSALGIDLETVVGQASNVEISVNPAGAVTNEILKATLADYVKTDDVKSLIPATVIDGSKPADFKEAVTLEKGAVDGTGNAIATTKNVSDGDAETLKSAKDYADTKISGKADDSKVVHTADMRKPASDVAGIEEVNALQTQVDNSAVGTNLLTGTSNDIESATGSDWLVATIGKLSYENSCQYTASVKIEKNDYPMFFQVWQADTNGNRQGQAPIGSATITGLGRASITFNAPDKNDGKTIVLQLAWSSGDVSGSYAWRQVKVEKGSVATDWCPNPEDKVNVADMRKPASDVAGIEEVNAKQDKLTITPADDSKVAHLSGAEEISGQKTFDVAPIDKTTGNPYITKDGVPAVPSTLADTTKLSNFTAGLQSNGTAVATTSDVTTAISTATANMVDSSKLTNFTAGLQSGGVDVATAADLKSIEASAWKLLVNSDATTAFYRLVDGTLYISGYARVGGNGGNTYATLTIVSQLPTELQNKVWTIQKKMTVGLDDGDYPMTAKLYFDKDSSLSAISSIPGGRTNDGIVIFNNSYTQS